MKIWGKPAKFVHAKYRTDDGREHENLLLSSGYWGLSRHLNYVFELLLAFCWTAPAGFTSLAPWSVFCTNDRFYFIFLLVLLLDRTWRDELRCAQKYGAAWAEYKKQVPYLLIPGVF